MGSDWHASTPFVDLDCVAVFILKGFGWRLANQLLYSVIRENLGCFSIHLLVAIDDGGVRCFNGRTSNHAVVGGRS